MTAAGTLSASPRTAEEPRAFTRTEFLRGTGRAWLWTTLLLVAAWTVVTRGTVVLAVAIILPASAVALVLGIPGAYALGRRLRSSSRTGVHVAAFAGYGAVLGSIMSALFVVLVSRDPGSAWLALAMLLINAPVTAIGLAGAWLSTARQSLRADAAPDGAAPRARDADAAEEDALDDRVRVIDPRQRPRV